MKYDPSEIRQDHLPPIVHVSKKERFIRSADTRRKDSKRKKSGPKQTKKVGAPNAKPIVNRFMA